MSFVLLIFTWNKYIVDAHANCNWYNVLGVVVSIVVVGSEDVVVSPTVVVTSIVVVASVV